MAVDSLQNLLLKANEDTIKVDYMMELSRKFQSASKFSKAVDFAQNALVLARKLNINSIIYRSSKNLWTIYNRQELYSEELNILYLILKYANDMGNIIEIAKTYNSIGLANSRLSNYMNAIENYNIALKFFEKINDKSEQVGTLNNIGLVLTNRGDYKEALQKFELALKISKDISHKKGLAGSLNNIGMVYKELGNYPEALKNYQASLEIKYKLDDQKGIANSLNNIGLIYRIMDNYPLALSTYFESLRIKESIGDKRGTANGYNNIGQIYYSTENYSDAMKYFLLAANLKENLGDKNGLSNSYNNIGLIYLMQNNYNDALYYYRASLKICEETNNKKFKANSLENIATIYVLQKKYSDGISNLISSLEIREEINDKYGMVSSFVNLGKAYILLNEYFKARLYLDSALILCKVGMEHNFLKICYQSLSIIDSAEGNYAQALSNYKLYTLYKDSILNEASNKQVIQMKTQYETEKKDKEIDLLNKDKEIQNLSLMQQKTALDKSHLITEKQKQEIAIKNLSLEKTALDLQKREQEKQLQQLKLKQNEAEMKEQHKVNQSALERQMFIRNSIIAGVVLLGLISLLLFNRFQLRKKIESQQAIIDERVRISRELHDDVGAQLSTAKMFLHDLKKNFGNEKGQEMLDNSLGLLDTSIKDLRVVMDDLRQSTLKDQGYIAATEEMVKLINRQHDIQFELSHHGISGRLPQQTEHHLFRITQELINNTLKYAKAKKVTIDIVKQPEKLVLSYEDDGIGFDHSKINKGYGLANMESRIQSIDGHLEINTSPGKGFMAIMEIPV